MFNGVDNVGNTVLDEEKRAEIYRALAGLQTEAWDKGHGYFYWSYKLLTDTVNDKGWFGWDSWDFG
ncbi:hypothetical protein RFZ45_05130, partial [Acinetobacter baumannii]|nr:hypothetical protein [Acinetobacter baumannii]